MGSSGANGLDQGRREKAAINQHEHSRLDGAEQTGSQTQFGLLARSQHDLDDGMGSSFQQVQAAQLRIGTLRLAEASASEEGGIGGGIIDIFQGAIDGHQPQPEGEGTGGVFASQQSTGLLEEAAHQVHADLFASIAPGSTRGQRFGFLLGQPAVGIAEFAEDRAQAMTQIQVPADEYVDHQHQAQFAHPRRLFHMGLDQALQAMARRELFQDGPRQAGSLLVITGEVRYSKGHEASPFDILSGVFS